MSTILTVTQINNQCKNFLEKNFSNIWIKGEVSKPKLYDSGHVYFILKDKAAEISCVIFNYKNKIIIKDGQEVVLTGNVALYSAKGKYQFIAKDLFLSGEGLLFQKYNFLKNKLQKEGLFNDVNKKEIPSNPLSIGVITSIKGAVFYDISNIIKRRAPYVDIYVSNTPVQGENASAQIINALNDFELFNNVDAIIIARGGGSFEDLMPFNDEDLVRKIFNMSIPIISAIGHETDFTLCDFVSDLRASTPSEAAEIIVKDMRELLYEVDVLIDKIKDLINHKIEIKHNYLDYLIAKFPVNPLDLLHSKMKNITLLQNTINSRSIQKINFMLSDLSSKANLLSLSNPINIKKKGYSIVMSNNKVINNVNELQNNDMINIDFYKGNLDAKVIRNIKGK